VGVPLKKTEKWEPFNKPGRVAISIQKVREGDFFHRKRREAALKRRVCFLKASL
jgi:hypothetical protein